MDEYPKRAGNCMEDYIEGDWELMCGKRNIWGEWHLCPKCRKLPENAQFLKKPEDKNQTKLSEVRLSI
jgi:hypothetical protein